MKRIINLNVLSAGLVLVIAALMHNDFLYKLPQQSRGKFFKAGMPPDNIHKLFCVHGGFLCFGSGSFFQLPLFCFIVCRQLCETLV